MDLKIGARIRSLRQANSLTLEELASRCELTKGFLSQLERDLTSPSISTLADILEAPAPAFRNFSAKSRKARSCFDRMISLSMKETIIRLRIVPNAQKNEMEPIWSALNRLNPR